VPDSKLPKKLRKSGILTDDEVELVKAALRNKMVCPAHNAQIIKVGPRKEEKLYANGEGPPFFHIGRNRYTTVELIEEWVDEMAQKAKQEMLRNFTKGRQKASGKRHSRNHNARRHA